MSDVLEPKPRTGLAALWRAEDWLAVWVGALILLVACLGLTGALPKIGEWTSNPLDGFFKSGGEGQDPIPLFVPLLGLWLGLGFVFGVAVQLMGGSPTRFFPAYTVVFILAVLAYLFEKQSSIMAKDLPYALWALLFGLLISNTIGTPGWLFPGMRTELYIKTGLVLLGAEVLFGHIVRLGAPGLFVAWLVTPIAIIFMYFFGVVILKMTNRSLVMVIAAATSVCGVSAAIAAAAACKASKEDLTVGVGLSLLFTVLMMILMPWFVGWVGMDLRVGGAWLGGTIDSTGAVIAAGSFLGPEAQNVASVVKMIQNVLIGVVAFAIAVYWVTVVERGTSEVRPTPSEIWTRLPKFILGFVGASLFFSFVMTPILGSPEAVEKEIIKPISGVVRGWLFALAFVSIGLESNFKALARQMVGGKPVVLYIVGQSFNLILTLIAAYLAFGGILFDLPPTAGVGK